MTDNDVIENIKLAFEYQKQGAYREAIAVLYKVLSTDPDNIEAIIQIAYLFYAKHDLDIAVEYYEKALQLDNKNLSALEGLLTLYKSTKEYKKALNISNKICEIAPDLNAFIDRLLLLCILEEYDLAVKFYETSDYTECQNQLIYFYAGFAYFHLSNFDTAENFFRLTLELDDKNTEALFYLAKILFTKGQYTQSDELLGTLLDARQSAKAYNLRGLIWMNFNDKEKAINNFTFAVKINSKNAQYNYNLAVAYLLNGWYEEAERNFQKAILLEPDNLHYHYMLAYLYYLLKDFSKAQKELGFINKLEPKYVDAQILAALISAEKGELVSAKKSLENLKEQHVESDFLFYSLGKVYKYLQMYAQAVENLKSALNYLPASLEYRNELADCYILSKDYENALIAVDKILSINKNFAPAYLLKTKILLKKMRLSEAREVVEKAINLDSNSSKAYFLKAQIYVAEKSFNSAIETAKKAIALESDNADYYLFMADIFVAVENYEEAYPYYKEALNIDTGNTQYYYRAAICAESLNFFYEASNYYSFAYRLDTKNTFIITKYADFLCRRNKHIKALKFLHSIMKDKDLAASVRATVLSKYEEIKETYPEKRGCLGKFLLSVFKL